MQKYNPIKSLQQIDMAYFTNYFGIFYHTQMDLSFLTNFL